MGKNETDFIDIQVWGKSAENCANYIGKGSLVAIQGSLRIDSYQNQAGETRRATRVNANRVQFLDTKNKSESSYKGNHQGFEPNFEPSFEPTGLDPQGFQAIDAVFFLVGCFLSQPLYPLQFFASVLPAYNFRKLQTRLLRIS